MRKTKLSSKTHRKQSPSLQNQLWIYRKRMGFSQKDVASLLGHKTTSHVSDYEQGKRLPGLETALKLEIILRVPVAFLYGELYEELKQSLRKTEERLKFDPL